MNNNNNNVVMNNAPVAWEPMVYTPQSTYMEKTVTWYKNTTQAQDQLKSVMTKILFVAAAIFCALAIVTIPLIINFTGELANR
jgi:hypothetical protein